jgi:uncharacterized protein
MLRVLSALLLLPASVFATDPPAKKSIEGLWYGVLKVGAIELRMGFHIEKKNDKLSAKMHTPDEDDAKVPMDSAEFKDGKVTLTLGDAKLSYTGNLQDDGNNIKGALLQGDLKLKLDLSRTEKELTNHRPQLPKKPYPYESEEVTFDSKAKDVKLSGTLTKPTGNSGSGPQDRDETLLGHKPFLVLADHLTRKGIAVLRYDDRGVAKSTGKFEMATSKDFAEDTAGAVAFLKGRKDVGVIGLIGHSEGGLIAPMVAADSQDVGFIVLLAGPGLPGDEVLLAQSELLALAMGEKKEMVAKLMAMSKKLCAAAKAGKPVKELEEMVHAGIKDMTDDEKKEFDEKKDLVLESMKDFAGPWMQFFLAHDPRPVLGKVKCPILAINGSLDLQVPSKANLEAVEKAAKAGGNLDVTTVELKGLNHLFQTTKTGLPSEYGVIEETFAPAALDAISVWVMKRFGK